MPLLVLFQIHGLLFFLSIVAIYIVYVYVYHPKLNQLSLYNVICIHMFSAMTIC